MAFYRKRPITIEARRWDGTVLNGRDLCRWAGDNLMLLFPTSDDERPHLVVATLEGNMEGKAGDFLVKGVRGEFYFVAGSIFAETYELVREE